MVEKRSGMVWEDPLGMTLGVAHPRGMQVHSIRVSSRLVGITRADAAKDALRRIAVRVVMSFIRYGAVV